MSDIKGGAYYIAEYARRQLEGPGNGVEEI